VNVFGLPAWAWKLLLRHLSGRHSRPAVRWMNRFAFVGVAVGVFAWISVVSVMSGLQGQIRDQILDQKPHLLWEGTPREGLNELANKYRESAKPSIKSLRLLLQTEGLLELPSGQGRVSGSGVVLQGVPELRGEVIQLGTELASLLSLGAGDEVRLRSAWKLELPPLQGNVSGVFETGVQDLDRSLVRVSREKLEEWLGLPGRVSRIEIQFSEPMQAAELREAADKIFGVPFKTWQETQASLWYSLRLEKFFMTSVIFFIVALAAMALHLALSVRVAEKVREIGVLRALGADARLIERLFMAEGFVLAFVGSALGVAGSWFFCRWISGHVQVPDFYYATSIPVDWNWPTALALSLAALGASLVASLGPARRATRRQVADALRG